MAAKVFKVLIVVFLLSTVQAGHKRRKKIIIYVPEVTKVIHHKHVAKVVVPQIIYKDLKPSKEHGVGLEGDYGSYAFEHVGKGYGGLQHGGAVYSTIDYGGKGYPGSDIYGGFSHEKGDFHGSASSHGAAYSGYGAAPHGGSYGAAHHGGSFGPASHGSDWKGDLGGSGYSAHGYQPQYAQPTLHREVVVRYGQPPPNRGWSAGSVTTGDVTLRRHVSRSTLGGGGGVGGGGGGGGGWVSVGGVEVARGRDVLAGA